MPKFEQGDKVWYGARIGDLRSGTFQDGVEYYPYIFHRFDVGDEIVWTTPSKQACTGKVVSVFTHEILISDLDFPGMLINLGLPPHPDFEEHYRIANPRPARRGPAQGLSAPPEPPAAHQILLPAFNTDHIPQAVHEATIEQGERYIRRTLREWPFGKTLHLTHQDSVDKTTRIYTWRWQ